MQQIVEPGANKKTPDLGCFLICNPKMDYKWNQVYSNLMLLYKKLDRLGFFYCGGKVLVSQSYVSSNSSSMTSSESSKL